MPKYCDHGAYIPDASITASFATSVMTVTATTNPVTFGMKITGAGIPANTIITSGGTGTGGAGTYNLSNTTGTLSSRTVTGSGGTFNAIPPTFGVPQDGDGVGMSPSTASATVNIDLTSATAAAGATISVAGAVMTCVASGATVAQFNAGSGATLATNIAAAINRLTNTATVAAAATGWSAAIPVFAACYARVVGNVLQIMFRAGSATHNGLQVVTAGFTGGTFGPYTFAGGVSGCWGLLGTWAGNPLGTANTLGLWGSFGPTAGVWDADDTVYIRSGKEVVLPQSTVSTTSTYAGNTTAQAPVRFIFDTNEIWTSDPADAHFRMVLPGSGINYTIGLKAPFAYVKSKRFSEADYGLTLAGAGALATVAIEAGNGTTFDGVAGVPANGVTTTLFQLYPSGQSANGRRSGLTNFYFSSSRVNAPPLYLGGSSLTSLEVGPGIVDAAGSSVASTGVVNLQGSTCDAVMRNVSFRNFVIGSRLHPAAAMNVSNRLTMIDCDLGNISHRGSYLNTQLSTYESQAYLISFTSKGLRDFSYDTPRGFCQWNSVYAQPTLNATLDDGTTKWSIVVAPASTVGACAPQLPFSTPRFSIINALPTGPRTFTVEIAISDQITWTRRDVSLWLSYTDASGNDIVLSTFDWNSAALTPSTSTWSNESGGKVVYVDSGTLLHNKFKLQLSTPPGQDLPLGAEVTAMVRVHNTVTNASQYLFVDPEIQVA